MSGKVTHRTGLGGGAVEECIVVETKRYRIRSLALFRLVVALVVMLVTAVLGGILVVQAPTSETMNHLRGKWKKIFFVYTATSFLMFFMALRLVVQMREADSASAMKQQTNGVRGFLFTLIIMIIFDAYIAASAFADAGTVAPAEDLEGAQPSDGPWISLMALSGTFVILLLLEVVVFVLVYLYHRSMRSAGWIDAVDSANKTRNGPNAARDEYEHFLQNPKDINGSTEVLHYTNDFTIDKIASDIEPTESGGRAAQPLLPPRNLVVNEVYDMTDQMVDTRAEGSTSLSTAPVQSEETSKPKRPKPPSRPPPPLPESSRSGSVGPELDGIIIKALSAPSEESSLNLNPELTFEKVTLPQTTDTEQSSSSHPGTDQAKPDEQPLKADEAPESNEVPKNDEVPKDGEIPEGDGTDTASPAEGEGKPPLRRQSSFRRYERKLSLRRPSGATSPTNPNFPPYEDTRFAYYDPERGTFARPRSQSGGN